MDLLQTDIAPNPAEMTERFTKYTRARLRGRVGNPVALKLPLWDPDRFLECTAPLARHIFTPFGAVVWFAITLPALRLVAMHWSDLTDNISDRMFAVESLILVALNHNGSSPGSAGEAAKV